MKSFLRTPFASALAGGLIVAVLGAVAISAGWIKSEGDSGAARRCGRGAASGAHRGDELGRPARPSTRSTRTASPGVAYIEADRPAGGQQVDPFSPFGAPGGGGGGTATGSGFVIDGDGRIVTNAHVVDGSDAIRVKFSDEGEAYDAELLGEDPSTDIAVIQVDAPSDQLHPIPLGDSSRVTVGDSVIAIGNPFGLDHTATAGIVSGVQREIDSPNGFTITDAIQTDAPINPGNSGGPLLDSAGEVIGVNSQIESAGGQGNVGIGFAVPINTTRDVSQQLIADGEVEHAFVGISGGDLTPDVADVLNLDVEDGAIVQSVVKDSPADEAGIEAGDAAGHGRRPARSAPVAT